MNINTYITYKISFIRNKHKSIKEESITLKIFLILILLLSWISELTELLTPLSLQSHIYYLDSALSLGKDWFPEWLQLSLTNIISYLEVIGKY